MIRTRAVAVIGSAFVPLPGAKFSMCTALSFGGQIRTKRSRRGLNRLADVVDDALDECWIVALGHDPDQGLGARFADDEPALAFELRLGGGDPSPHAVGFERFGRAVEADVLEQLRQRLE